LNGKVAAPVWKTEFNGRGDPLRNTVYPQKLALTSPTSGGRSVVNSSILLPIYKIISFIHQWLYSPLLGSGLSSVS
jgi:hypothetical protein